MMKALATLFVISLAISYSAPARSQQSFSADTIQSVDVTGIQASHILLALRIAGLPAANITPDFTVYEAKSIECRFVFMHHTGCVVTLKTGNSHKTVNVLGGAAKVLSRKLLYVGATLRPQDSVVVSDFEGTWTESADQCAVHFTDGPTRYISP